MLDHVTPLILTYNEEANIGRTLDMLTWAREVVVLDSGSSDQTCDVARRFPNVRLVTRPFDNHAAQWNHGLQDTDIQSEWVLALDADYILTQGLVDELGALAPLPGTGGFRTRFRYFVLGKLLSGSMYPPVVTLYRRQGARYVQDGHTQRVVIDGSVMDLNNVIDHDDRKPLSRWLVAQDRYAQLECDLLRQRNWAGLRWQDRIRKMIVVAPWLVPLYCLTFGLGFKDGWAGLYYALQRGVAETILSLKLLEAMVVGKNKQPSTTP